MKFLGKVQEFVSKGGVTAYIRAVPPSDGSFRKSYEIVVDYHGRKVRGTAHGFCLSQQVAVSQDGKYAAFINMSGKPGLAYMVKLKNMKTGLNITRLVWGIKWNLVLVTEEGEKILMSGVLPVIAEPGSKGYEVIPKCGCPKVAFSGHYIHLLSVNIYGEKPVAEVYVIDASTDEVVKIVDFIEPPPVEFLAPIGDDASLLIFPGSALRSPIVAKPNALIILENVSNRIFEKWRQVKGGVLVGSVGNSELYFITPEPSARIFATKVDDFAASPSGEWVALAKTSGLILYRVRDNGFEEVFSGFKADEVDISDDFIAFRDGDSLTVITYPPSVEVVAKISLKDRMFRGSGRSNISAEAQGLHDQR